MPTQQEYVYRITTVYEVKDGDTYILEVDLGFYTKREVNIRLAGFDTPELFHPKTPYEYEQAKIAKAQAELFLTSRTPLWVATDHDPLGGFGRWLGVIWGGDTDENLGVYLLTLDLATVWPTRWHDEYDKGEMQ